MAFPGVSRTDISQFCRAITGACWKFYYFAVPATILDKAHSLLYKCAEDPALTDAHLQMFQELQQSYGKYCASIPSYGGFPTFTLNGVKFIG